MYYALTNFYQNHLRYYLSRDANQLKGNIGDYEELGGLKKPSSACGDCDLEDTSITHATHACSNLIQKFSNTAVIY
jgi:hypothetical protein